MHREARDWVTQFATDRQIDVIEIGSLNVNGTIRDLFPNANWTGLDRTAGSCVDWVGDAEQYEPVQLVDMAVCCEVLEHAQNWRELIAASNRWLKPGGVFILTCAGLGRTPHNCDGGPLTDEYYGNLSARDVKDAIRMVGYTWHFVRQFQTDVQGFAIRSCL